MDRMHNADILSHVADVKYHFINSSFVRLLLQLAMDTVTVN